MSVTRDTTDLLDRMSRISGQQWLLRAAVLAGAVVVLVAIPSAGGGFHPLLTVLAVLVALLTALLPESHVGVLLVLSLGLLWVVLVPEQLGLWLLVATAGLGLVHWGATLAAYGPSGHHLDAVLLRAWGRRAGIAVVATLAVWLLTRVLDFLDLPPSRFALGAALLVLLAWVAYLSVRFATREE